MSGQYRNFSLTLESKSFPFITISANIGENCALKSSQDYCLHKYSKIERKHFLFQLKTPAAKDHTKVKSLL